jgi:hypothetical protein
MEALIVVFEKFGLPISFLIVMIWLFIRAEEKHSKQMDSHRDERKEWRESQNQLQCDTTKALNDLTDVIRRMER